jgi:selenoprotein W-related protein
VDEQVVFDRKTQGRFPEIKELKQLVRDKVCPGKNLGHSDKQTA